MQDDNAIFGQFTWNFRPDESDVSFDPDPENKDHGSSPPRYIAHKCVGNVIRNYLGVTGVDLIDSPVAVLRVHNRGCWDSFKTLQYTQDHGELYFGNCIFNKPADPLTLPLDFNSVIEYL